MLLIRHYRLKKPYHDYSALTLSELDKLSTGVVSPDIASFEGSIPLTDHTITMLKCADKFVCSHAVRTQQTCTEIMSRLCISKTVEISSSLNEIYFKPSKMIALEDGCPLEAIRKKLYSCILDGCSSVENIDILKDRLDNILEMYRNKNTVLFTHGFLIRLIKSYISCDKDIKKSLSCIDMIAPIDYLEVFYLSSSCSDVPTQNLT